MLFVEVAKMNRRGYFFRACIVYAKLRIEASCKPKSLHHSVLLSSNEANTKIGDFLYLSTTF